MGQLFVVCKSVPAVVAFSAPLAGANAGNSRGLLVEIENSLRNIGSGISLRSTASGSQLFSIFK